MPIVQRISIELLLMAAVGLVLGLLGPFGTYDIPLALRLTQWIFFILIGYAIFRPITRAAIWLHEATRIPQLAAVAMAVAVAALPLSLIIGYVVNGMRLEGPMLGTGFLTLYLQCAGIGVAIFFLVQNLFFSDRPEKPDTVHPIREATAIESTGDSKTKLHDRLPPGFPDRILALGVEDHYVRVHAPDQSEMLLMRLGDAMAELDGLDGMQVHRSWWAARDAVVTTKRQGRNWRLVLSSGLEIPVARTYVAKLKDAGWIN